MNILLAGLLLTLMKRSCRAFAFPLVSFLETLLFNMTLLATEVAYFLGV